MKIANQFLNRRNEFATGFMGFDILRKERKFFSVYGHCYWWNYWISIPINNFLDYSFYFRRLLHIRMQFDKSHRFIAKINSKGYSSDGVKTLLKMNHVLHN